MRFRHRNGIDHPSPLSENPSKILDQSLRTNSDLGMLWSVAAEIDNTLQFRSKWLPTIRAKQIQTDAFSRMRLFQRMEAGTPVLFSDFPIRQGPGGARRNSLNLAQAIACGFPAHKRARVRSAGNFRYLSIPAVIRNWETATEPFGVTDLHYIGTRFDSSINTEALNDFNLLPRGTDGFESQDSLVISTFGAVTDSHSDDHSGSNHCFTGSKLWLLWDTHEGLACGLEDVSHCDVYDRAAFDLSHFLSMNSSRWILIRPGQTMFIPANLTHKVITLDRYLGLGSFNAGLPGFVDLLIRWTRLHPQWASKAGAAGHCSVTYLTQRTVRIMRSLKNASNSTRYRWGVPFLKRRLHRMADQGGPPDDTLESKNMSVFLDAARSLCQLRT